MMKDKDIEWANINHPDLFWDGHKKSLEGELAFSMYYSPHAPNQYIINPVVVPKEGRGELIQDVYELSFRWSDKPVPAVKEVGGRIERSAKKWGVVDLLDMHMYQDGRLCLYPVPEEVFLLSKEFSLENFFHMALIPYLYYQSFFEKHGQEPWVGSSHGALGLLESYQRIANDEPQPKQVAESYLYLIDLNIDKNMKNFLLREQLKGHYLCWCNSGKKFRNCHKQALWGFNMLKRDLQ